jgi:hypothetical protein
MSKLEKANAFCSVGTFILTAVIVVLMVWPPQQGPAAATPKGQPMTGWVMPSILAFCLVLAGVLHLLAARTRRDPSPTRTEVFEEIRPPATSPPTLATQDSKGRIFVGPDITPQFLSSLLTGHTEVQAEKLLDIYIGKWIRLSGDLSHVGKFEYGSSTVMFSSQPLMGTPTIVMQFGKAWTERLSVLRLGNNINIIGRI